MASFLLSNGDSVLLSKTRFFLKITTLMFSVLEQSADDFTYLKLKSNGNVVFGLAGKLGNVQGFVGVVPILIFDSDIVLEISSDITSLSSVIINY